MTIIIISPPGQSPTESQVAFKSVWQVIQQTLLTQTGLIHE